MAGAAEAVSGDLVFDFKQDGDFEAMSAAETFLQERGFSVGSNQRGDPCGIMFGDYIIAKWCNLNKFEQIALHGIMTGYGGSMRAGPVKVTIFATAPTEARAAIAKTTGAPA